MNATDHTTNDAALADALKRALVEIAAPYIGQAIRGEISTKGALVRIAIKIQAVTGCTARDAVIMTRTLSYSLIRETATTEPASEVTDA